MSKTRVPAIPAPTDANLREVARAVKSLLDVREGLLGDPLDANVTFRDLQTAGVIQTTAVGGGGGRVGSGGLIVSPGAGGGTSSGYDPAKDLIPPPPPENLQAAGALTSVILTWDSIPVSYPNHAYTEVWRADENVIGNAVMVGTTNATVYADALDPGQTRFYWIRHRSQADVAGPYNATEGVSATTGEDVSAMVAAMTGEGKPFTVLEEPTDVDGVTFPAGIYSTLAFIQDLQVTNAKIANLAVDNAKIADLSVAKLTGGEMNVGSFIQSTNYTEGASGNGWRINADGTAELQAAFIRGQLVAGQLAADSVETNTIRGGAVSKVVEYTWTWSGTSGDETFVRYLNMPFGGTVHYILVTQIFSTGLNEDDTMASDIYFNGVMLDGITGTFDAAGFPVVLITSVVVSSQGTVNFGGRLRWNNIAGGQARARALVLVTYR